MRPWLWLALGHSALGLGVVGIFLPLLPTTPFLLVAAYCYGRGSPRFEAWLLTHPRLGPVIQEWRQNRIIPLKAKLLASLMISLSIMYVMSRATIPMIGKAAMLGITVPVLGYILSRPSRPC